MISRNGKASTLNLDELFGVKDPVIVVYQDVHYELKRTDAWTPEQYQKFMALQNTLTTVQVDAANNDPKAMKRLLDTIDKILGIVSPEMALLDLPLEKKSAILNHYAEQVFPEQLKKAKEMRAAKNTIGA